MAMQSKKDFGENKSGELVEDLNQLGESVLKKWLSNR
jgi:hypothetical protein